MLSEPARPGDDALGSALAAVRARGGLVVSTNGCFDLLHAGHVRFLTQARAQGDSLVVGLNSDASVRALKGPGRPRVPAEERAEVLRALRAVDHVVVFDELLPTRFLEQIRPDVHCKGGDYSADLPEAAIVRAGGGRVQILALHGSHATTSLARRLGDGSRPRSALPTGPDPHAQSTAGALLAASNLLRQMAGGLSDAIGREADRMARVLADGGRILVCGNGGSASDAQHFAAELVGRFRVERGALPAISLAADASVLTAIANDYGFAEVFARQVQALGRPGDLLLAISASGRSVNVREAVTAAAALGLHTTALTGRGAEGFAAQAEHALVVPSDDVPLVQQGHRAVLHALCARIDATQRPSAER
jgi:D-sedoheptulose 7-phosphate isomerase